MDDLLNNAPCGFLSFTDDGMICESSATLHGLLGVEQGGLQGQRVAALLSPGGRVFWQTHLLPLLLLRGAADEIYLSLRTKGGSDLPVLVSAVRRKREGRMVSDCVFLPMRQRLRYEEELLQARKAAEEASAETARANAREHVIAVQLQEALQPALPCAVPGLALAKYFEPALQLSEGVGGDFYDVFALEKGRTALIVGDLSGKGLAAAAQVATVRNMLRGFLYTRSTLAQAAIELNQTLAEHELLTGFTTLFIGAYDPLTRTLDYVSCGQEPALLRRALSGEVEELGPTGPVLGAIEGALFAQEQRALSPGDSLAIFTDGLTEVGETRAAMLGIEGVTALFRQPLTGEERLDAADRAEHLALRLIEGVDKAAQNGVRDDVCLLVAVIES